MVDVVGASPLGQASSSLGISSAISAAVASEDCGLQLMAISGMEKRRV
jgi:hypothetical protein